MNPAPVKTETITVKEVQPLDPELITRLENLRRADTKWRRIAQIITLAYQFMSTVLSAFVLGALAYSLDIYLATRNRLLANGQPPWPNPAVLWPTYLLLGVSVLTFVTNGLLMFVPYMHRYNESTVGQAAVRDPGEVERARRRTGTLLSSSQYLATAIYFIAWAVSSGLFQMANTGQDLWGWSCSPQSDAIQEQIQNYLDFGRLCLIQGASWDSMVLQAAVWALAIFSYSLGVIQWRRGKAIRLLESQLDGPVA